MTDDQIINAMEMARDRIEEQNAEIAALKKQVGSFPPNRIANTDVDRINFLEKHDVDLSSDGGCGDGPATWYCTKFSGNRNDRKCHLLGGQTLRDAIDAAITHYKYPPR